MLMYACLGVFRRTEETDGEGLDSWHANGTGLIFPFYHFMQIWQRWMTVPASKGAGTKA